MPQTESDRAYQRIKDRIVSIRLTPGSVIREGELSEELDIGRTPIREALKRLEAEKLVVALPHRGMHVAEISITDLTQIYEVRLELEAVSASLAALRMQRAQLAEMRQLAHDYEVMQHDDLESLFQVDRRFHMLVAEGTHNRFLEWEIGRYYDLSLRVWNMALRYVDPSDVDVAAHLGLLECVEAGDPKAAAKAMREHIESFHQTIKQYL
jgi:DNA-binding GntR family transcriptional regulator